MQKRSVAALVAGALGLLGLFDVVLGPVLIRLGWVSPMFGFQWMFLLGLLEGLLALAIGLFALWRTRPGAGRTGRPLAWVGVGAGVVLLGVLGVAARPGADLPRINDITTDPDDPPVFVAAVRAPANEGRDLAYPGAEFAAQQRAAYPEVTPIRASGSVPEVTGRARSTAESLGWEIVDVDPQAGHLEARETSALFRFVDDVVVRVRPHPAGGTVVDVRSKSRDGRGDLGANAARIRAFSEALPR